MRTKRLSIVITGSHGVGKTTLAEHLSHTLSKVMKVTLVPETARLIVSKGFEVNDKITVEGINAYLQTYETNFAKARSDLVISDRCILDLYAYTEHLYVQGQRLGPALGEFVMERVNADLERHDLFIFVPSEFEMHEDGLRPTEAAFQAEIESRIENILLRGNVEFVTVNGSIENRIDLVAKELERRFGLKVNYGSKD